MHLKVILKRECKLISKACAYSQGVLVLEVLMQEGPSVLVGEGRLCLKGI